MADAAAEWGGRGRASWLVAPTPRRPFYSAWGRPLIRDLLDPDTLAGVSLVSASVDHVFELGTRDYRAHSYARAVREHVPVGVPLIVSDDPDVWRGAALLAHRNPMIGVLHADDDAYYALAKRYHHVAAALVCVSSRIARATRAILGDRAAPSIATIACGIPLPPPPPSPRVGGDALRLSWAGRMDELQKRVSDLVRIIVQARNQGIAATLDVLGDGPDRQRVEEAARQAGVRDVITFHGWQPAETVMRVLRDSDAFLLPSNFEGMPVAIMEALASGCAVVATRVSGIEDYDESPSAIDALWTFSVGDVAGAVDRLQALANVPRARRQQAARTFAEMEFAIGTCMDRYESLLARLAGPQRHSGPDEIQRPTWSWIAASIVATARRARLHLRRNVAGRYAAHD